MSLRVQLDPLRPGITYIRNKGHFFVRILDPKTKKRLFLGCPPTLHEAQRLWDKKKAELDAEMSGN